MNNKNEETGRWNWWESNRHSGPIEHFYKNIDGWFDSDEDFELYASAVRDAQENSHFVEIGSFKGKSSALMAVEIINSRKKIFFDCIDTWNGSPEHKHIEEVKNNQLFNIFLENIKPVKEYIHAIRMDSKHAHKLYNDKSLDFVFLDGDHSYEAVKNDITNWLPKIKDGGVLSGHDYGNGSYDFNVKKAVDEIFPNAIINKHIWKVIV